MFQVAALSLQTAFSANMLQTEDPDMASTCLEGIFNSIRVAGRFACEVRVPADPAKGRGLTWRRCDRRRWSA
jgi:hypothetical protein